MSSKKAPSLFNVARPEYMPGGVISRPQVDPARTVAAVLTPNRADKLGILSMDRTVGKRSLSQAGVQVEFLDAKELAKSKTPLVVEGVLERWDPGRNDKDNKIKAGWRLDFFCRYLKGDTRGASGVLSLQRDDMQGNAIISRRRFAQALQSGVIGPVVVTKQEGQTGFINFEDYEGPESWEKLTKDLPIEPQGYKKEARDTRDDDERQDRREQRTSRSGPARAQRPRDDEDDFPEALKDDDDDLPF